MGQVSHQYLILMHLTSIIQIRTYDNIIDCQQQGINVMSFSFEVLYQQAIFLETIFFCISNSMYQKVEQPSSRTFAACIKIINLIAAGVVMASGIIGIVYMFIHNLISSRFLLIFNPIFLILFGFMMVAAEFKIRVLLKECHFLTHLFGRGVFFLYLASSVYWYFSFGTPDWTLTYVTSMTIFAIGVLYLILHCCGKTTVQKQYIV